MFVVATTLALLAAMGVYALSSTSAEVRVSGYQRQAMQTHYVTELGTGATADTFSGENATYIDNQMRSYSSTACKSTPTNTTITSEIARRCVRISSDFLKAKWSSEAGATPTQAMDTQLNLFGTQQSTLRGGIQSEITEPIVGGLQPGFDTNNNKCFRRYTISTYGRIFDPAAGRDISQEAGRARVVTGPFECGG
jgi:hypothetical protein